MRADTSLVDIIVLWSPLFLFLLILCGSGKNLPMSACLILLHLHALIFGLVTSFAFPLHLIELVNPYALCGIFVSCVLGWHVKHYVPYISKTMLMLNAHPCSSLTEGLTMSLTQFWLSQFLCLIFSYRSTICLLQVLCFISYLCSLARFWCLKWFWGSEDAMFMHLVFKCNYSNRCINLGELSYFI